MKKGLRTIIAALLTLIILLLGTALAGAGSYYGSSTVTRIKDVAKVQGARSNQLVGYGLVVGLTGTGDTNKSKYTFQSIYNMLKGFGVTVASSASIDSKNVASVIVTAQLPAFVKPGDAIDVTVSSMGDAKSLQGGTLIQTPLKAGNGNVYAVAQGQLTLGGFSAKSGGSSQQKNFLTVGSIPGGAFVEKDVTTKITAKDKITLSLNNPDFTTATRIAEAIDNRFNSGALASDAGTIDVPIPSQYADNVVAFVAAIEELTISPDMIAKVVVNERTGTVVIGSNVAIDAVAVAQGGLSVRIDSNRQVSQPPAFSGGSTAVTNNPSVKVEEKPANLINLPASSNVGDVVSALNAVGATPRDIISILQAMKAAGALHADLQVM